jgi:cephalosporin-C deacetylase-like acetyl esterase
MIGTTKKILACFLLSCIFTNIQMVNAAALNAAKSDDGEVIAEIKADNKLATFEKTASFSVSLKNTFNTVEEGKLSYQIFRENGEKLTSSSKPVKLSAKSSENIHFDLPEMKSGFYKISFMINVTDYDDTLRKAFGISPQNIRYAGVRPPDFDAFWQKAKDELARVKPEYKITEQAALENKDHKVFLVEMKSLDGLTIRGWLTTPSRKGKFSVYLDLPGYQVGLRPQFGDGDLAILSLNVRGHGNSRDVIHTDRPDYVTLHLDDKNKYVYRGAIMDCIRAVDFINSRPELDNKNIIVTSDSQGAYLALALSSLDQRIKLCSAKNPIFCDFRDLFNKVEWPSKDMARYTQAVMHGNREKLMENLDYFDCVNFAVNIHCNVLMGMGLLDFLSPPDNVYTVYNLIPSKKKKILIYPNLTHEVGGDYQPYEYRWSKDEFGLYN